MSMLADHRRKTKWVINPTKKPIWSTDSSGIQFGKQLMEKMGWSAGKGLGLNEQGIQEPLKVSFKNDTKGMGFKGNDDDWIEHQDEFNILLNQLRGNDDSSTEKPSDVEKNEIKSLEEKSKRSKARVHYQKFTRGKDLSKYSENDLACILGTGKTKKKDKPEIKEVVENKTDTVGNFETSFGVTTINSGSINDYFKKKRAIDKLKPNGLTNETNESEENFRPCFSVNNDTFANSGGEEIVSHKKKHKSKCEKENLIEEERRVPELNNTEKGEKKKRKAKVFESNSEEEPESSKKKRKNSCGNNIIVSESLSLVKENDYNTEKKKKKDKNHVMSEILNEEIDSRKEKDKKERKKTKRTPDECTVDNSLSPEEINNGSNVENTIEEESVKRKKKKKEKTEENELIDGIYNNSNQTEDSNGCLMECHLGVEPIKSKKKKNRNLEMSEEKNNSVDDVHSSNSYLQVGNTEKMNDVEVALDEKKKKKKDKKEKVVEFNDLNKESQYSNKSNSHQDSGKSNSGGEGENNLELNSGKKKRKKRDKNLEECKEVEYQSNEIETFCSEETSTGKIDSVCEKELEVESIKKKKKKKDKKEKFETESKEKEHCLEEDNDLDVESVEKKKKKKHKKEKEEGIENKDEPIGEHSDLCNNNNEVSDALNTNKQGEDRMQKLRTTLFPDQSGDKYFPAQGTNERVLKLIKWANIAEFKGSNLSDVEGYGRRKMYEKNSR